MGAGVGLDGLSVGGLGLLQFAGGGVDVAEA